MKQAKRNPGQTTPAGGARAPLRMPKMLSVMVVSGMLSVGGCAGTETLPAADGAMADGAPEVQDSAPEVQDSGPTMPDMVAEALPPAADAGVDRPDDGRDSGRDVANDFPLA